ncbi:MAG: hypothetical protein AB4426_19410 [Xenococcaceae cyanobacterium]
MTLSNDPNQTNGYGTYGYGVEEDETTGYSSSANQGNYDDGYQENIYDQSNLADSAWTDSAANPNPQLEL